MANLGKKARFRAALVALPILTGAGAAQGQVLINEVDYDQPSTDTAEFIELVNTGADAVELSSYALQLINGANGGAAPYATIALPAVSLPAGGYYVVCADAATVSPCDLDVSPDSNLIQNGAPDGILLLNQGVIVDGLSYEGDVPGVVEGASAPTDSGASIEGLSRCPDSTDTDRNDVDILLRALTPGAENNCPSTGPSEGECGDPAVLIHDVQGSTAVSPLVGSTVEIEGVVVGNFQSAQISGYFVQEEDGDADADPNTSEGVFVYSGASGEPVMVGERVRVAGQVSEFSSLTEISNVSSVLHCGASVLPSTTPVSFPVASLPALEALEGMLVSIPQTMFVTGNYELGRYGSLDLAAERLYIPTHVAMPGAEAALVADLNARSRIVLDDARTSQNPNPIPYKDADNTRRAGDTVTGLTGILSGRFGTYRIQPTAAVDFENANVREADPADVGGTVRVASFNVYNFFTTLDDGAPHCGPFGSLDCRGADSVAEYERQLQKTLNALQDLDADVVTMAEVENNALASVQALADGLNQRLSATVYAALNTGTIGTDAIKLGILYKPAVVSPVGSFAVLDSSVDPRFLDDKNRPALAQTFEPSAGGQRVTVVVNHLKSKGSACTDVGDPDLGDGQGNCNQTRLRAVQALVDWLADDPTGSESENFLVVGDFNAYAQEDPIVAMEDAGFESLIEAFGGDEAYSYVFAGESGYLDHAFASESLSASVTGVTEWHINADEPVVLDYNLEFKTDDPFNGADAFRASDHDPLLIGLDLSLTNSVPTCMGLSATIYVDKGVIVGGPDAGMTYAGSLRGTGGDDVIVGSGGDDTIDARGGDDVVCGKGGADFIEGGAGDDRLAGGGGRDVIRGNAGDDELRGNRGDDLLEGNGGDDLLKGGKGDDQLRGGAGDDLCRGQAGNDHAAGCEQVAGVP